MSVGNYSILVDVELQTQNIKSQLNKVAKEQKIPVKVDSKDAVKNLNELEKAIKEVGITFQESNLIMSRSIDAIVSMVDQVYELDTALTEFKKVSDLSGISLDNYVSKLSEMGAEVARTGKPKCQAPDDGIVNQHQEPLEIQYSLRAYLTTMDT